MVSLTLGAARLVNRGEALLERSGAWLWLAVFVPIVCLYLATLRINAGDMITDTVSVTSSGWQLAHHGTPRIPDGTTVWDAWMIPSGSGHIVSNREPGLIGLAAIFYLIFHSASILDVTPASIAAAVTTAAAVACLTLLARTFVSMRAALVGGLLIGTGTTMWAVAGTSLFPHGPDALYLAVAMLAVSRSRFALAGVALALAILTRPPLGVVAVVFGLWFAVERRSIRPALNLAVPTAAGTAGFFVYSHEFWGGGLQSQYTSTDLGGGDYTGKFSSVGLHAWADFVGNIWGTLVSPGRGILIGSPLLIVLALGLRPGWRVAPPWVKSAAVAGAIYLAVLLKASRFQGGSPFWGYRYPLEALTLMAPLLVLAWREYALVDRRRHAWFSALAIASVAWEGVGAICFRGPADGTIVWNFTDLRSAISNDPVVASAILLVGYLAAAVIFRHISRNGHTALVPEPPRASV